MQMPNDVGGTLLDTHVWFWLMHDVREEIGDRAARRLREDSRAGRLLVSVISVWEIAMLVKKGRVQLPVAVDAWVKQGLAAPGVRLAPLTPEAAVESTRLPGDVHGDPADRFLIATARELGARIATRDHRILDYGASGHVDVLDVRPGPLRN